MVDLATILARGLVRLLTRDQQAAQVAPIHQSQETPHGSQNGLDYLRERAQ